MTASEHKATMEGIIRELAAYAGASEPAPFAEEYAMVMEGAYVTAQVARSFPTIEVGRRLARLLVEKYIPEKS